MSFSLCENVHSCKVPFFGGSGSVTERADVSLLVVKQIHLIVVVVDVVGHVDLSLIRVVSNSVAPLLNANSAGSCHFPRAQSQYHEAASPFGAYLYTLSIRGCTKLWFHIAENV